MEELFYDPRTGYGSKLSFYNKARQAGFKPKEILEFLRNQETLQIHKEQSKTAYFPNWGHGVGSYQMDIMFQGNKAILNIINVNTRMLYGYVLKNETGEAVLEALKEWFSEVKGKPTYVQSDNGRNLTTKPIRNLMKEHRVDYEQVEPYDHRGQSVVERAHQTLRRLMTLYRKPWLPVFKDLIYNINHRINRDIGVEPVNATEDAGMLKRMAQYEEAEKAEAKLKVGDFVRKLVQEKNDLFLKGKTRWSGILQITGTNGFHRFELSDGSNALYYNLQKVPSAEAHKPTNVIEPDRQAERRVARATRTLRKEGIKDFLTAGTAEAIKSNKRQAKAPEEFVAEPSNRMALKPQREAELAKVKKQGARIPKFVQKYEDGKWIRGAVVGDQVRFLDGSTSPFSLDLLKTKQLYKFPTDTADKKALPKLLPQLAEL